MNHSVSPFEEIKSETGLIIPSSGEAGRAPSDEDVSSEPASVCTSIFLNTEKNFPSLFLSRVYPEDYYQSQVAPLCTA